MNYEKIIVELLSRIQVLEEKVEGLLADQSKTNEELQAPKITTEDIRRYIAELKNAAQNAGKSSIILRSGDIHKALNLKNAIPQVCNAMRQSMKNGDVVLHTTPSGNSSTIEIEYKL